MKTEKQQTEQGKPATPSDGKPSEPWVKPEGVEMKAVACRRLQKEGRYEDFLRAKREYHAAHPYRGVTKDQIFYEALLMFPPLDSDIEPVVPEILKTPPPQEPEPETLDELAENTGSSDIEEDIEWAYDNMGRKPKPSEAPSQSAYAMWEFSQEARVKFIEFAIALNKQKQARKAEHKAMSDDQRRQFAVLTALDNELTG